MAGAGYKLFNTGDVLTAAQVNTYLMEQTVMVFADAAARTAALSGVVSEGMISYLKSTDSVEVYNGSAWVSVSSDQTPLTTKGDLFTFTTTDARLAVGNNGETLVADSSASTGLRWAEPKTSNPFLNSAFQIWQRGTSIAGANSNTYTADRWCGYRTGSTYSRQTTGDTTNLPNIQYCMRVQRDSGGTGTSAIYLTQALETINSIQFAGKIVTLSFYARKGANYSAASDALSVTLQTGTGTDQGPINNFTGFANPISTTATLTSTWQRFSFTSTTLDSALTQIRVAFLNTPVGTAGAADYYEITGVQLDIGSVAQPFRTTFGTLAGELAACQRYFEKSYAPTTAPGTSTDVGPWRSTGNAAAVTTGYIGGTVEMRVTKRVAPTVTLYDRAGTSGKVSRFNYGSATTDNQNGNTYVPSESCFMIESSGTSNNAAIYAHWTASAEL